MLLMKSFEDDADEDEEAAFFTADFCAEQLISMKAIENTINFFMNWDINLMDIDKGIYYKY